MPQQASFSPDIIEIQPCTEEGLVTLEAKLGGKDEREMLDPVLLCRYLNAAPAFENPRCSPEMGYGMLERDGRKIHAFKTGKVIVRRVEGREQALGHLHLVSRTIWPALRVNGGDALVVCLGSEKGCERFPAPPADGGDWATSIGLSAATQRARGLQEWNSAEEGLTLLRAIAAAFPRTGAGKGMNAQLRKAEAQIIRFLCEVKDARAAAVGIPILAASLFLDRTALACERLPQEGKQAMWDLTVAALEAFVSGRSEEAGGLRERLRSEGGKWDADLSAPLSLVDLLAVRLP